MDSLKGWEYITRRLKLDCKSIQIDIADINFDPCLQLNIDLFQFYIFIINLKICLLNKK